MRRRRIVSEEVLTAIDGSERREGKSNHGFGAAARLGLGSSEDKAGELSEPDIFSRCCYR